MQSLTPQGSYLPTCIGQGIPVQNATVALISRVQGDGEAHTKELQQHLAHEPLHLVGESQSPRWEALDGPCLASNVAQLRQEEPQPELIAWLGTP